MAFKSYSRGLNGRSTTQKKGATNVVPLLRYRQVPFRQHKQKTRPAGRVSVSIVSEFRNLAVFKRDDICVNANL